jgi:hypothetical protein
MHPGQACCVEVTHDAAGLSVLRCRATLQEHCTATERYCRSCIGVLRDYSLGAARRRVRSFAARVIHAVPIGAFARRTPSLLERSRSAGRSRSVRCLLCVSRPAKLWRERWPVCAPSQPQDRRVATACRFEIRDQPCPSWCMASTSNAFNAYPGAARASCRCSNCVVPVSGTTPTRLHKANTTCAGVQLSRRAIAETAPKVSSCWFAVRRENP